MKDSKRDYIRKWRNANKDKVRRYNQRTLENKIQKEVERRLSELI